MLTKCALFVAWTLGLTSLASASLKWEQMKLVGHANLNDKEVQLTFRFRNDTNQDIRITSVRPDCNCTIASASRSTVAPSESGELRVVYTFRGDVINDERVILVRTSSDGAPDRLSIVVSKPKAVDVSRPVVIWKRGESPTSKAITISIHPEAGTRIAGVESQTTRFDFKITSGSRGESEVIITPVSTSQPERAVFYVGTTKATGLPGKLTLYALVE